MRVLECFSYDLEMMPWEFSAQGYPVLKMKRGESITVGYGLPPQNTLILHPKATNDGISFDATVVVARIFCDSKSSVINFSPLVKRGHTQIMINGRELDYREKVEVLPGSLIQFGRVPHRTSFVVMSNETPRTGSEDFRIPVSEEQ